MIHELNLSKRSVFILLRADITTVKQLRELSEGALEGIKGIGKRSMQEINEMRELLSQ